MSTERLTLDSTVDARLTDILGDLAQASASVDVAAAILADSDVGLCGNVEASQLGLSLKVVHRRLHEVMDRLDSVNLLDPSRRMFVCTPADREVPAES